MCNANDEPPSPPGDRSTKRFESENAAPFAAAACFIRESQGADTGSASHGDRQQAEQREVIRFVEAGHTRRVADAELEQWPVLSDKTSEHKVFLPVLGLRVIKVTWPGFYGQIPVFRDGKLDRANACPSEYLERQALQNEIFASDLRLEGVNISDRPSMVIGTPVGQPSFVVSQGFIEAAQPANPVPAMAQIEGFLREHDFEPVPGSYFGWIRRADGVAIVDAKPDNFILSVEGVVPIDLQIARISELLEEQASDPQIIVV